MICARYTVIVSAHTDAEIDQIIRELGSHRQPERGVYVSITETERELER